MTRGVPYLWLGVLGAAVLAAPAMKYVWVVALTGNANLLFNMCLALAVAGGSLVTEFAAAAIRTVKVQRRLATLPGHHASSAEIPAHKSRETSKSP
jgi:hypothetical protein